MDLSVLAAIKALVRERCGLILEGSSADKLRDALQERIAATGCAGIEDYRLRLHVSTAEFQELVNRLTINETYFFREPQQLRLMADKLVPRLLARRGERLPLRILSAGCSSGEEPYSIVIELRERYGDGAARLFQVAGGDIDTGVLARAREGVYSEFSFRGVPADVRSRYFDKEPGGYRIGKSVRDLVGFHELNLFANVFPPALREFDIVFLRNVSIYFDAAARRTIQQNLSSLMKDDGILVIGTAETLANDLGVLPMVEEDGLFYFAKDGARTLEWLSPSPTPPLPALAWPLPAVPDPLAAARPAALPPESPWQGASLPVPTMPVAPRVRIEDARALVADRRYDEAAPLLESILAASPADKAALLLKAHVLVNRKEFAAAEAAARRVLDAEPWCVDACLLAGLAAKWREQAEEAIRWFKQAAYARQECWPAHYYLGDLYRLRGEHEAARRAYRVALQALAREGANTGIEVVPFGLPANEIRFLCEHHLARLGAAPALAGAR